jgi:hypothetical protein
MVLIMGTPRLAVNCNADWVVLLPQPRTLRLLGGQSPLAEVRSSLIQELPPQGYRLTATAEGVELEGADDAGLFYGRATLDQLRRLHGATGPSLVIEDWPDLLVRGVMLDVSRDKVPTMATLRSLIDRLASWKINHLQLYMEHTFASEGHDDVWRDASPFTGDELDELDAFCRQRHIELAPNQNCLGHMERWLALSRYRSLAARPDGFQHPFGFQSPPTTLDPGNPGSLALARDILGQLLRHFSSRRVHVGLDEPWELGEDRIDDYVGYLARLRAAPELDGREMLVWGDVLSRHPVVLDALPDGVTVCEWWYEAGHPWDERLSAITGSGREAWACPGTSAWSSLVGHAGNGRVNCRQAARSALRAGASGYLVTDWGDHGHINYLPSSEPLLAYGGAVSWCFDANVALPLAEAVDLHVFDDPAGALGEALLMMSAAQPVSGRSTAGSALAAPLYWPDIPPGRGILGGLTVEHVTAARVLLHAALDRLDAARSRRPDGQLVVDELRNAAAILLVLCDDSEHRLRHGGAPAERGLARELAHRLAPTIVEHRRLWLSRNRPGGMEASASWLERLLDRYSSDERSTSPQPRT